MVNYTKNRWNNYDTSKTFSENLQNDAILTLEKALHIEQGIYDANRVIEIGDLRIANDNEPPSIKVVYNEDSIVMNFVLPRSTVSKDEMNKILDTSKEEFIKLFSRIYVGEDESVTPNNNDVMFILTEDGTSIKAIRTFYKNIDGSISSTDLKLNVDITSLVTDNNRQFITKEERDKLRNIEAEANKYIHPTGDGNLHVPANGTENNGKYLKAGSIPGNIMWDNINKDDVVNALGYTPADVRKVDGSVADSTKDGLLSKEMFNKINNIEENANNYQHPDTHPADMITETNDKQFISENEKELLYYNNENPTLTDHGGIPAGTTFNNRPISDILGDILYPYVQPSASCTVITPSNGGTFEAGAGATVTNIRVSITKKSKDITKIELFASDDMNNAIATQTENVKDGGTFNFTVNRVLDNIISNLKFRARVTDASSKSVTVDSGIFNVIYPMFYGAIGKDDALNSDNIKALTKIVQVKGNKSLTFNCDYQRMVFAYPASYGNLNTIIDPNNFNITETFTKYTVNIAIGTKNIDYFVYVNDASTVSNFTISFKY